MQRAGCVGLAGLQQLVEVDMALLVLPRGLEGHSKEPLTVSLPAHCQTEHREYSLHNACLTLKVGAQSS